LIERALDQDLATVIADRITGPLADDTQLDDGSTRRPARLVRTGPGAVIDMLDIPSKL
jgi:hypothetical protein